MTAAATVSKLRLLILNGSTATSNSATSIPSPFPPLLEYLTEVSPSDSLSTFVGYTSHPPLHLRTKYYDTQVTIWCDELPPPDASYTNQASIEANVTKGHEGDDDDTAPANDLAEWQSQMLSDPALEVRSVIGGIILVLHITPQQLLLLQASSPSSTLEGCGIDESSGHHGFTEYLRAVHSLRERIEDEGGARDVAGLVILQLSTTSEPDPKVNARLRELSEKLETWCHDEGIFGLDFVTWDGIVKRHSASAGTEEGVPTSTEKNEYGEKVGIHRLREVLEAVDWTATPGPSTKLKGDDDGDDDDDISAEDPGLDILSKNKFNGLDSELQEEMMGLKLSMLDFKPSEGDEDDNDHDHDQNDGEDMSPSQMHQLMERVVAIREAGVDLPRVQREVFAKREVEKILRELM